MGPSSLCYLMNGLNSLIIFQLALSAILYFFHLIIWGKILDDSNWKISKGHRLGPKLCFYAESE